MAVHECDVCVIGGGITAAMLIERLADLKPGLRITAIEAVHPDPLVLDYRVNRHVLRLRYVGCVQLRPYSAVPGK